MTVAQQVLAHEAAILERTAVKLARQIIQEIPTVTLSREVAEDIVAVLVHAQQTFTDLHGAVCAGKEL